MQNHFLLVLLLFLFRVDGYAQSLTLNDCIEAWKDDSRQQSIKAYTLYRDLENNLDSGKYSRLNKNITDYLADHKPSTRVQARAYMYRVLYQMLLDDNNHSFRLNLTEAKKLMLQVQQLGDEQLLSEFYAFYAENCSRASNIEEGLFYNIKALQIQESIGMQYFPNRNEQYLSTAVALYKTGDYQQSLFYSKKCDYRSVADKNKPRNAEIYLYNMIAGAYERLGQYDTARHYYQEIVPLLNNHSDQNTQWLRFWKDLTQADIAKTWFLQNGSYPGLENSLLKAIAAAREYKLPDNAATLLNILGRAALKKKNNIQASQWFRTALNLSSSGTGLENAAHASYYLAAIYQGLNNADSVAHYLISYNHFKGQYDSLINQSRLSSAQVKLDFEYLQTAYQQSTEEIKKQKYIRNSILIAIVALSLISVLLYNRSLQNQKFKLATSEYNRRLAEQNEKAAKQQIDQFKERIIEKDRLIHSLKQAQPDENDNEFNFHQYTILTDDDWVQFKKDFSTAYPQFFTLLDHRAPDLSPGMARLCALISLKFDNKQIAGCLGISESSVARSKRRLRQRLHIEASQSMEDYLADL